MADLVCSQCGAQFTNDVEGDAEGAYCPDCGAFCPDDAYVPAVTRDEVIDVEAEPVEPGGTAGAGPGAPPPFERVRVRTFRYRSNGAEGQGCCCLGCLVAAFLVFLLFRGLLSLFGIV